MIIIKSDIRKTIMIVILPALLQPLPILWDETLVEDYILQCILCICAQIRISQLSQKDHLSSATPTAATSLGQDAC